MLSVTLVMSYVVIKGSRMNKKETRLQALVCQCIVKEKQCNY